MKRNILLSIALLIIMCGGVGVSNQISYAQSEVPLISPTTVQDVQTTEIKGEVLKHDGQTLTVDTDSGTKQVPLSDTISVKKNTVEVGISEIKPGDSVTITQSQIGEVLSIDATAGEIFDWGKYLVPLLIVAVILAFLVWRLLKNANKPHIKTAEG